MRLLSALPLLLLTSSTAHAQLRFDIGIGGAFTNKITDFYAPDPASGKTEPIPVVRSGGTGVGVFVYPKYHFFTNKILSVSAGVPLLAGYGFKEISVGSIDVFGEFHLAYDVSATADINFGIPNPKKMDDKTGAYIGAGFGVQRSGLSLQDPDFNRTEIVGKLDETASSAGFLIHTGLMFNTGLAPLGVRVAYRKALDPDRLNFLTFAVFVPL